MNRCCICNLRIEPHLIYKMPAYKCYSCNGYYIDGTIIDAFMINYANNIIKYKSNKHKDIFINMFTISNKAHIYINEDLHCMYGCRDLCYFYKFKYKFLTFRYCNFINKYYIKIKDLEQYIYKSYKLSLIYYYKEIIFGSIKKLFVKE